ncbi:MAG: YfhO family protein [Anaerotruncus sp.]|nr:MAG: YfhO family protein [Anaerotruncus sp.]
MIFIETHFAALETTIRSSGDDVLPNVYTSVLTLILLPLYFANGKIRFKEKTVYGLLITLFFSSRSIIITQISFGMRFIFRMIYRTDFLICIALFCLLSHLKLLCTLRISKSARSCSAVCFWAGIIAVASELSTEKISETSIYVTAAFLVVYAGTLVLIRKGTLTKFIAGVLVTAMAFCEVVIADPAAFGFNQQQSNYVANYDTYREAVNYIEENDKSDYRTELCSLDTRMDDCLYGYNGMSIFSSMAYEDYSGSQYSLGMYGNRINSYTYNTQTPVYNMMYNIKYLIHRDEEITPSNELYAKYYETENSAATVYENRYFSAQSILC